MTRDLRFYLDQDGMSVWRRRRGQAERIADFPETTAGREAFSRFLEGTRKCALRLLVNRDEERYLSETLPALKRSEARRLAEARSRRAFPDSPWRCVHTTRRRAANETTLSLMALDNSASLADWITRLQQNDSALTGIHSLAQLLPALYPGGRKLPAQLRVLTKHRQRCRLTELEHGLPRSVRWFADDDAAALDEIGHLLAAPSTDGNEGATWCIVGPADWPQALAPNHYRLPGGDDAATLILGLPDRCWPEEQFAPASIRAPARQRQIRRRCWQLALLAWLIGLPWALERQLNWQELHAASEREQAALQQNRQALASGLARIAGSGMTAGQLLEFAEEHAGLQRQKPAFADSLSALGQMLDRAPEIRLQRLDWAVPTSQGLPRGTGLLVVSGSMASTDAVQAGQRLHQFIQTSDRSLRILDAPQPGAPGEFRFVVEIGAPSP